MTSGDGAVAVDDDAGREPDESSIGGDITDGIYFGGYTATTINGAACSSPPQLIPQFVSFAG